MIVGNFCVPRQFKQAVVALLLSVSFVGCTSLKVKNSPEFEVNVSDLTYSGRGAGAGVALVGSMGPMGVAIGAAIDEGIAKNIRTELKAEQFDFTEYLYSRLKDESLTCSDGGDTENGRVEVYKVHLQGDYEPILSVDAHIYYPDGSESDIQLDTVVALETVVAKPFPVETLMSSLEFLFSQLAAKVYLACSNEV